MVDEKVIGRNLISTISDCLKEHQVNLESEDGESERYLIEVKAISSLHRDFIDTYNGEIDDFKKNVLIKFFEQVSIQTYGVLVDTNLKYEYAFNRRFADVDKDKKKIVFRDNEEALLDLIGKMSERLDLSTIEKPTSDSPFDEEFYPGHDFNPGSTLFRYSITGKKEGINHPSGGKVSYEKRNLLDRIKSSYEKSLVDVKINDEVIWPFFLVNVEYQTSTLEDFMKTYHDDRDKFKERVAMEVFGNKKSKNEYSLLLNPELKIVYAFNTRFARYDRELKTIKYTTVEEVLLDELKKKDNQFIQSIPTRPPKPIKPSGQTLIRYSIIGKD